jgi:predicted MFS family arabinose efflux permease
MNFPPEQKEWASVLVLAYLAATGAIFFNIQPVFLGALAAEFSFNKTQLGSIVSAGLFSAFTVLASSFFWVTRARMRSVIVSGASVGTLALLFFMTADSYEAVLISCAAYGGAMGAITASTMAALAATRNPEKSFGITVTMMVSVAGLIVFIVPALVIPVFGFDGMLMVLAAATAAVIPLFLLAPIDLRRVAPSDEANQRGLAWVSLCTMAIYFFGLNGTWAFLEIIGNHLDLSPTEIGFAFSGSLFMGAGGSLAAVFYSGRSSLGVTLFLSFLGFILFVGLISVASGFWSYLAALAVFNITWNFSLPFAMNITSKADDTGRFTALIPAAQTFGGALGPLLAGSLLTTFGPVANFSQLLVGIFIAFLLYLSINRRLDR